MAQRLDVIINMDPRLLPLGIGIAFTGQWLHGRAIKLFEQVPAATGQLFEGPAVEVDQQPLDFPVEFCDMDGAYRIEAIIGGDLLQRVGAVIDYPNSEIRTP